MRYLLFFFLLLSFSGGCASQERFYEGMYEGFQKAHAMQEERANPAVEPIPQQSPDYRDYKHDREEVLRDESGGTKN